MKFLLPFLRLSAIHPPTQPSRGVPFATCAVLLLFLCCASVHLHAAASNSIARVWNERALAAIRVDTPHPPAQARNYFSFSVCMYDAWAVYDPTAIGYIYRGKHTAADVASARSNAISYAVYRMMKERHVYSRTAATTLTADDNLMTSLGYDINNQSRDTSNPTGVGNSIYDAVSAWFRNDGSRQTNGIPYPVTNPPVAYPDYPQGQGGYVYINPPLATDRPGITDGSGHTVVDPNRWQRLQVVNAIDQNGFPQGPIQPYLGAQWLGVRPFAMTRTDPTKPWIDPGPPPFFNSASHAWSVSNIVEVIRYSSELTPDDGVLMDISPASLGNNSLGANDGHGRADNPVTGLPYAPNMAKRGDFARALTEFWADGPTSETPPGHWNVIANNVADSLTVKRIAGTGPALDDLEWDVKVYFALNAALHEAACAAWSLKRYYDAWRPLTAIRYTGGLGQSSDPGLPSYHVRGLPLVPNLIELVTSATVFSGRHAGLTPGKIAVFCWPGQPNNPATTHQGVKWLHAENWMTYQTTNFVTPAFPGYISGHSTFSRSAAELMTAITGSEYFPGGLGSYTITRLVNEQGPSQPVTLQWATYFDAADQVGISRIWGGIHPPADDFAGRRVGAQCGLGVWSLAQKYFDGSITNTPINLAIRSLNPGQCELSYTTLRGFNYKLQAKSDVTDSFTDAGALTRATNTSIVIIDSNPDLKRFYQVVSPVSP